MGDVRTFDLSIYKNRYDINTFVETGTLYGDSIEYFKDVFDILHSIEIDEELFVKACSRFKDSAKIKLHLGDSLSVLSHIVPTLTRSFFWLDAHFPGADCHKKKYNEEQDEKLRIPLKYELEIIRNHAFNDVIIIDDLWLYEDGLFEWGTFDEHSKRCSMGVTRKELMGEITSEFVYDLFGPTHIIEKIYKHQGYLILTPKDI